MDALLHIFKKLRTFFFLIFALILTACVSHPPADVNNLCNIFRQYPKWYRDAKDVERRWKVPIPVQMAIIHQESKFNARARPPRQKLFCIIPWKRPSSAYGYTQALHGTWNHYKQSCGGWFASRDDFADGVDFIGWYANEAYKRARVPRTDAYLLYLAYHEGIGGYQRKTYLRKSWLIPVARKVKARSQLYAMQLNSCKKY
ncbi:transglycosylase SLT domain-containing protein [Legionella sp. PATHC038]|uniref:transglycosylase SLT domain-containing protein n=1 Tax=Legionella TaxID=445 RepID=UPI002243C8B5|nr:transglycosylase SLT domain-containing protein [Legionella sp. PATHC038]MCW8399618.1 transglycosylase SLT domain-containing protein [Legionella sp. PATHC038]